MCVGVCHAYRPCLLRCQLAGQGLSLVNLTLANAVGPGQFHLTLAACGGRLGLRDPGYVHDEGHRTPGAPLAA